MSAEPAYRAPRRDDYLPIVKGILPFCQGEELTIRASLLLMRDMAKATKPIACESAWALLDIVEREADAMAFRGMPIEDLREVRRLCSRCVATASGFDALYQPRLPLDQGEANGRG